MEAFAVIGPEVEALYGGHLIKALRLIRERTGCTLHEGWHVVRRWQQVSDLSAELGLSLAKARALDEGTVADVLSMLIDRLDGQFNLRP